MKRIYNPKPIKPLYSFNKPEDKTLTEEEITYWEPIVKELIGAFCGKHSRFSANIAKRVPWEVIHSHYTSLEDFRQDCWYLLITMLYKARWKEPASINSYLHTWFPGALQDHFKKLQKRYKTTCELPDDFSQALPETIDFTIHEWSQLELEMIYLHNDGYTYKEIAKIFRVTYNYVFEVFKAIKERIQH